jgi:small-conductance mechanosensitive channel
VSEVKSPEALLQDLLTAEQNKTKQLETERNQERDARGKAEQTAREANTAKEKAAQELATEREAHTATKAELTDANTLVDQLTAKLSEPSEAPKVPTATLGSGKDAVTYRLVVPQFYLEGFGKVRAADVKNNSDVLKALVKVGSAVLEQVPAK